MAAANPADFFNNSSRSLTNNISAMVNRGVTSGFNLAARGATANLGAAVAANLNSSVQRATAAIAITASEMVSTGRAVVDTAVEAANARASQILQSAVAKIGQWQSYLTGNILNGLSRVLSNFVTRTGSALGSVPQQLGQMFQRLMRSARGPTGALGDLGQRAVGGTLGALAGTALGNRLLTRYNAATGRYHSLLSGRMVSMGEGREERGSGLISGLWTRLRESVANLGYRVAGVFRMVADGVTGVLRPVWEAVRGAVSSMTAPLLAQARTAIGNLWGAVVTAFGTARSFVVTAFGTVLSGIRTAISTAGTTVWDVLSTAFTAARTAIVNAVMALARSPYGIAALVVAGGGMIFGLVSLVRRAATAVAGAAGNIVSFVSGAFTSVWGVITAVGTRALAFASTGYRIVSGALGTLFRGVGNFLGMAWGWLNERGTALVRSLGGMAGRAGGLGSAIAGVLQSFIGGLRSFATSLLALLGGLLQIGVALGAMAVFAAAVNHAARAAMEFAKAAQTLSATSGLSLAGSGQMLLRNRALGIGDAATEGSFNGQPAFLQRMKAGFWGLPGMDSADFWPRAAQRFQSLRSQGWIGQLRANAMARSMGLNSPEQLNTLMMDPRRLRSQLNYADNINGRLGLTPDMLAKYAQEIPLAVGRIGVSFSALTMKLAGTALPIIERVLDVVNRFAAVNADNLGGTIEKAVEWVFVSAPVMLAQGLVTVTSLVSSGVAGLLSFGQMVADTVPRLLSGAVHGIAGVMNWLADGITRIGPIVVNGVAGMFETVGGVIAGWLDNISSFLMDMTTNAKNPLRSFALAFADFLEGIKEGIATLLVTIGTNPIAMALLGPTGAGMAVKAGNDIRATPLIRTSVSRFFHDNETIQGVAGSLTGGADWLRNSSGSIADFIRRNGMAAVNDAPGMLRSSAASLTAFGDRNIPIMEQRMNEGLDWMQRNLQGPLDIAAAAARNLQERTGTVEERRMWLEMIQATRDVEKAVRDTSGGSDANDAAVAAIAGRILSYMTTDRGIGLSRGTR